MKGRFVVEGHHPWQAGAKGEKPLTMEKLLADMDRLGWCRGLHPDHSAALGYSRGVRVFVSDYLPDEQPRKLTRRERFWLWVESLCDQAEIYYYGPKIKRTEPAPAYLVGRDLYVPRRMAAAIRMTEGT